MSFRFKLTGFGTISGRERIVERLDSERRLYEAETMRTMSSRSLKVRIQCSNDREFLPGVR